MITPQVSHALARRLIWISDSARFNGIHILGGPGSGKSWLMARVICWLDFLRQVPLVVLDPTGGTWASLCAKILRLPEAQQKQAWRRVVYIDMGGRGTHVVPFPLYYRREGDSLATVAQRYLEVVRRMDPALMQASVEGMNAVSRLATYTGMILAALGFQITEAFDLIRAPERWQARFAQARELYPEVQPAIAFFREFVDWPPELRARRADAFLIKLMPFEVEPRMAAMFGGVTGAIDWEEVVSMKKTVILDASHEVNPERRRLKLLWVFLSFVEFLKLRGVAGRLQPVSFVIDEVTQLLGYGSAEHALLAIDLEELVSVIARNFGVWLTISHQSLAQVDGHIRTALMQMGTQVVGVSPNPDDALYLARQFTSYSPHLVKKTEPVWMGVADPNVMHAVSVPTIIDRRAVEYSPDEQFLLAANAFGSLRRFQFLVRTAVREGDLPGRLRRMSIEHVDRNQFPDYRLVAEVERRLMARQGVPVEAVLAEISTRLKRHEPAKKQVAAGATMKEDAHAVPLYTPVEEDEEEILREEA